MKEKEIFKKNFPGAEIDWIGWGSYRINTLTGFVEYDGKTFTNFCGGHDIYRGVALSCKDMGRPLITVDGPEQHILASIAAGEEINLPVVPEIKKENKGCSKLFLGFMMSAFCAGIISHFTDPDTGNFVGAVAGLLIMVFFLNPIINKQAEREARLRGQIYRNPFPPAHGDVQRPVGGDEIGEEHYGPRA